jgi:hypothetical protein
MKLAMMSLVGMCALTTSVGAAVVNYEANLDGLQVVPPNASPAFGQGQFSFDTGTGVLTVTSGSYQDLLGGATSISLNGPAAAGVNGVLISALTLDTPGAATGTFSGAINLTAAQATALGNEQTYVIIRSQVFPSGEIRGQLFQVPAPGAAALLGLAGLTALRRRR